MQQYPASNSLFSHSLKMPELGVEAFLLLLDLCECLENAVLPSGEVDSKVRILPFCECLTDLRDDEFDFDFDFIDLLACALICSRVWKLVVSNRASSPS